MRQNVTLSPTQITTKVVSQLTRRALRPQEKILPRIRFPSRKWQQFQSPVSLRWKSNLHTPRHPVSKLLKHDVDSGPTLEWKPMWTDIGAHDQSALVPSADDTNLAIARPTYSKVSLLRGILAARTAVVRDIRSCKFERLVLGPQRYKVQKQTEISNQSMRELVDALKDIMNLHISVPRSLGHSTKFALVDLTAAGTEVISFYTMHLLLGFEQTLDSGQVKARRARNALSEVVASMNRGHRNIDLPLHHHSLGLQGHCLSTLHIQTSGSVSLSMCTILAASRPSSRN